MSNSPLKADAHPLHLDPKRPNSWGRMTSTAGERGARELPVKISVLVKDTYFVGLRGPARVLEAIREAYLHDLDVADLYDECSCPVELLDEDFEL